MSSYTGLEIAIIGMGGRFPDAPDLATFWRHLAGGVESIHRFSAEELAAEGLAAAIYQRPDYVPAKGDLADAEAFDADFFGFSPREAQITDPQQRLFLENAWHAFENAGYDPANFDGLIGVYAGASMNRYQLDLHADPEVMAAADAYQLMLGNDKDFLTTRVSYKLGLEGPSVAVQTACSTSLVAVHMAVQALNGGECDLALAGGASVRLPRKEGYLYREGMILSPDGHCRAFDAEASGTVEGNGLGIVVLRRLEDALAAGDPIRAVIKGSAINNDGAQKVGFTAPRVQGQARAIRAAQMMAEIDADSISYIEAHGTATPLGDSIEVAALTRAFRATTERTGFCALGSVKTNIGHLDAAAGVAGLIKTVLALEAGQIPPSLHYSEPPDGIDLPASPFFVNTELREWTSDGPRRAGVSSFGIGGTNAHVVLEEAPKTAPRSATRERERRLLVLSGRTRSVVEAQSRQLADHLDQHTELALDDVVYTLQRGRRAFEHRRALVCRCLDEAAAMLRDEARSSLVDGQAKERGVAFLFPGQGAQYAAMGGALRDAEPAFATAFNACRDILRPLLGIDVLDLRPEEIRETAFAQPYLMAIEVSLATMWRAWGVEPRALLGHSLGELSAACVAGVLPLAAALELVVLRGRWMQEQPPGAMLSVPIAEEELRPLLGDELVIAALNITALNITALNITALNITALNITAPKTGPTNTPPRNGEARIVVSGPLEPLTTLETRLRAEGLTCKRLRTSHAFHSPMMAPVATALTERLRGVDLKAPEIPFISNLSGTWIEPARATDPEYWAEQMLSPVRFADGLQTLARETDLALLEVGPGRQLSSLARRHPAIDVQPIISSLGGREEAALEGERVLNAAAKLWVHGVELDWPAFPGEDAGRRIPLPTYPFERQPYGMARRAGSIEQHLASQLQTSGSMSAPSASIPSAPIPSATAPSATAPSFGPSASGATAEREFLYLPTWRQTAPLPSSPEPRDANEAPAWLIFVDALGVGDTLAERLERDGARVHRVRAGSHFERQGEKNFTLDPERATEYDALFTALRQEEALPSVVVHAWTVADDAALGPEDRLELAENLGFGSLLHLARALGRLPAGERRLVLLTSHMQRIAGEAAAAPEKAVILGPGLVIPQEFPGLACQIIDLVPEPPGSFFEEEWLAALLAEMRASHPEPLVAFRDGVRWLREFEALPSDPLEAPSLPTPERDGTYLITGGLGEMGLTFAELLVEQGARNLVLLSRTGLEPEVAAARDASPSRLEETIHGLAVEVAAEIDLVRLDDHAGLEDGLRQLSASYALDYLRGSGLDLEAPQSEEALRRTLGVIPSYNRFFDYLLGLLESADLLHRDGRGITVRDAEPLAATTDLQAKLERQHPQFGGLFELLQHCASHFDPALRGEIPGISVLYPNGNATLLERTGSRSLAYGHRQLYAALLGEIVARRAADQPERTIRILEVGGGTGILTWALIHRLASRNVEHHFTDIGPAFVAKAREQATAQGLDFLRFATLDISTDPLAQGFAAECFDFVIGLDVVHAAPSIPRAVEHLKTLLKPGGELLLVERVEPYPWVQLIWGLAKDWWIFDDGKRRDQPLISTESWRQILKESGFAEVCGLDRDDVADPSSRGADYALLAARKASAATATVTSLPRDDRRARRRRRVEALEERGTEVMIVRADVSDRAAMSEAFEAVKEHFESPIRGVIHAAGVLGMGVIQRRDLANTEVVLAPKLRGTLILDELLQNEALDFFVLCSSLSGLSGNVGQVDYCAANAFLDAYAHFARRPRDRRPLPALAIDWARWREAGMAVDAQPRNFRGRQVEHPLLQRIIHQKPKRILFHAELEAPTCWVLDEHRLVGRPVMPGTAYLEMARAALENWRPQSVETVIELRDVLFWTPLVQPDEAAVDVFTLLEETAEGGFSFQVLSSAPDTVASGGFVRHASGRIHVLAASATRSPVEELRSRISRLEQTAAVEPEAENLDGFGPRWHTLERSHFGDGEALGVVELATEFDRDREQFLLHPAVLDAATSFAAGRLMSAFQFPLSYDRVRLFAPLGREVHSLARWQRDDGQLVDGQRIFSTDVILLDPAGRLLVEIEGFTKRGIDMEQHRTAREQGIDSARQLLDIPANALLPPETLPELGSATPPDSEGLRSAQGKATLARLLTRKDLAQVVVSTHPLQAARNTAAPRTEADAGSAASERLGLETAADSGSVTEVLIRVWRQVLGVERVAVGDNFFELGGDSILALQLITRAKEAGLELHPGLIFQHQTIAELARALGAPAEAGEYAAELDGNSSAAIGEEEETIAIQAGGSNREAETPWTEFPLANLDARSFGKLADQIRAFDVLDEES